MKVSVRRLNANICSFEILPITNEFTLPPMNLGGLLRRFLYENVANKDESEMKEAALRMTNMIVLEAKKSQY